MKEVVASFDPAVKLMAGVDESIRVKIPPSAFRRVLINLVNNGIKYGNKVSIQLEADSMRVLDDGPGIPMNTELRFSSPFLDWIDLVVLGRRQWVGASDSASACLFMVGLLA